jgi:hypothetical protein
VSAKKGSQKYDLKEPDTKCNGRKTGDRGYCKQDAGANTWHKGVGRCSRHGGASPTYINEVHRLRAQEAVGRYGLPVKIEPKAALIGELERTQGHVTFLELKVNELEEEQMVGEVGASGEDLKTGLVHKAEAKANIWINMYQAERKHLEDIAKACIAAGIEERRVRLAEQQGELIASAITGVLDELVPGWKDRKDAPAIVRKHLTLVSGEQKQLAA